MSTISLQKKDKALFSKVKEDLNKWRDIPCSQIGRTQYYTDILQTDLQAKCNSNQITIWQTDFKFNLDMQSAKSSQDSLEEEQIGRSYSTG